MCVLAYIVCEGGTDWLCVLDTGDPRTLHRFRLGPQSLARLAAETSTALLNRLQRSALQDCPSP